MLSQSVYKGHFATIHPNPTTASTLTTLHLELRHHLLEQHHKQTMHFRANFYFSGNKAGRLLAARLKEQTTRSRIPYLLTSKASPFSKLYHSQNIAEAFKDHYESLYNLKDDNSTPHPTITNITKFLDTINLPRLTTSQLDTLTTPFMPQEIHSAIQTLPNGKSPGGFSYEYYKLFSLQPIPYLREVYHTASTSAFS